MTNDATRGLGASPPEVGVSARAGRALAIARWVVLGLSVASVLVTLSLRKLSDFDLPGHLAVGRLVAERRAPLRVDELSFTHRPIEHVEYVSDLLLYATARMTGPIGLEALGALLAVLIAVLLWSSSPRQTWLTAPVVALCLAAMQPWLLVRPATFSFVLLALLMSELARDARGRVASRRRLFWIVPGFLLWSNVHGFVVLGLAALTGYAGYTVVCRLARGRAGALAPVEQGHDAGIVVVVAALSIVASCCNQAGYKLLAAPLRAANDFGHIAEWETTSLDFLIHEAPLVAAMALLALLALAMGGTRAEQATRARTLPTLFDCGVVAIAFVLGRSAVRMLPIALLLVTPVILRRLGARLPRSLALETATASLALLTAPWMRVASPAPSGVGFDPSHFSEHAIEFVQHAAPRGNVYNTLPLGGWFDWRLFPAYRSFVDHRQGWVHDPAVLHQYYASEVDQAPFDELARRFDFQWAFVFAAEGSLFGVPIAHSPSWAMVYWDDATAIYVRVDGPNAKLAHSGYRLLRHLTAPADILRSVVARDATARALALDGKLAKSQAPLSPRATFLAGCAAIATADREGLDAAVADLARLAPESGGDVALRRGWELAEHPEAR